MVSKDDAMKALDRIWNFCEEIDFHLPPDEQTGYKMLPDYRIVQEYLEQDPEIIACGEGELTSPNYVAHWIALTECSNEGVYCSHCRKKVYKLDYSNTMKTRSKFCPNCGFKMLQKVEEL